MKPHTRAMIAAASFAVLTGKKVAGLYDHTTGQDLRIAAEARGDSVQGFDGDRAAKFGGTLPEIHDAADQALSRAPATAPHARPRPRLVNRLHRARRQQRRASLRSRQNHWFSYDVLDPAKDGQYYRVETAT